MYRSWRAKRSNPESQNRWIASSLCSSQCGQTLSSPPSPSSRTNPPHLHATPPHGQGDNAVFSFLTRVSNSLGLPVDALSRRRFNSPRLFRTNPDQRAPPPWPCPWPGFLVGSRSILEKHPRLQFAWALGRRHIARVDVKRPRRSLDSTREQASSLAICPSATRLAKPVLPPNTPSPPTRFCVRTLSVPYFGLFPAKRLPPHLRRLNDVSFFRLDGR